MKIKVGKEDLHKKIVRSLSNGNEFVSYVDAIGHWTARRVCWICALYRSAQLF